MVNEEAVAARQQVIREEAYACFADLNEERITEFKKPLLWEDFYTGYLNGAAAANEGLI